MPTYLLDGNAHARIAAGPVKLEGHTANNAKFTLTATNSGQVVETISPRPGLLVIPKLAGRVSIIVAPAQGQAAFAQGTVLNLTIGIDGPLLPDPERIILSSVDLSGLGSLQLLALEGRDGMIVASASATANREHDPLIGLSKAAQVATRSILGTERVDETSTVNIVVALDTSASMHGPTRDGSVQAVVEVLTGISRVVSPGRPIAGALISDKVIWVEPTTVSELAEEIAKVRATLPYGIGFRSASPGLIGRVPNENTVTYLLTDSLPPDISELHAANDIEGEARHLVIIGDHLTADSSNSAGLPVTSVEPVTTEEGLAGRLEFDSQALQRIVKSLLAGCFVPGTEYAKRVSK